MALTLIIFLPVTAALFWTVIITLLASRTETYRDAMLAMLFTGLFLFGEGCYAILEEGALLLDLSILMEQLAAPIIVPVLINYMQKMLGRNKLQHPLQYIWLVVTIAMFTTSAFLFLLRDDPRAVRIYDFCTDTIFKALIACELVWMLIFTFRAMKHTRYLPHSGSDFLFRGKPIATVRLQLMLLVIPLTTFAIRLSFPRGMYRIGTAIPLTVALLMTIFIFLVGLVTLFGTTETVSLSDLRILLRFNYNRKNKGEVVEQMLDSLLNDAEDEALRRIQEKIGENLHIDEWKSRTVPADEMHTVASRIFQAVASDWDEDSLLSRFQHLMVDEQFFLNPSLTLGDVADRLHSNKTYISKLVHNSYNLGFPELINILRVDYAEQYIINHRDAKQTEIAEACGFLSASSFNNIFKKVTGITPRIWIASLDKK